MDAGALQFFEVIARWGYSEVVNCPSAASYDDAGNISAIREKRVANVPFELLTYAERDSLAVACYAVRPNLFHYMKGISSFNIVDIDKSGIEELIVPPNVWYPDSNGQFVRFIEYISTKTPNADDARNVTLRNGYVRPAEPLTITRFSGKLTLIDGFHRAASFLKFGPKEGTIRAYVPA